MTPQEASACLELASLYDEIEPNTANVLRAMLGEIQMLGTVEATLRSELSARSAPVAVVESDFSLESHLYRQGEFSERTFGPGPRPHGIVDHIQKELREVLDSPEELEEWIDVVILAFDGALRAGHSPRRIITALVEKQMKNEARTWPDWRTAEPGKAIEHVRDSNTGNAPLIVVTCRNEILREDGSTPFWKGPAERIGEIRSLVARDLAVEVVKDGQTRKSGMWTVELRK